MKLIITREALTDEIVHFNIQKSVHATVRNIKGILSSKILGREAEDIKLIYRTENGEVLLEDAKTLESQIDSKDTAYTDLGIVNLLMTYKGDKWVEFTGLSGL